MKILNRKIGPHYDPLIIAEIGINHNGDILRIRNLKILNKYTFEVTLNTGKNHEIRRIFRFNGLDITELKRVKVGNYQLNNIEKGNFVKIEVNE